MPNTLIVVPCFNEADRLPTERFARFAEECRDVGFLFVDDGSSDRTADVLRELAARDPKRFSMLELARNSGKGEAVRRGMLEAFSREPEFAGFFDADLATPLGEALRLRDVLRAQPETQVAMGARVQLLGRDIRRSPIRHYLGRVFATVASLSLDLAVYDTQCGAKLFRNTAFVRDCFAAPFLSKWIFDVELIARMKATRDKASQPPLEQLIFELPLYEWTHVADSKITTLDLAVAAADLLKIHRHYRIGRGRSRRS